VLAPRCLEEIARADLVVHAGDFTGFTVYEELARLAPLEAVHGNADDARLKAALPERRVVEADVVRLGVVHDGGRREGRAARLTAAFPGCAAVVYGHSHLPELARHEGVWILNPGSPSERRRAPHRSLISLEVHGEELRPRLVAID
jgi:putative phosphoesterase